MSQPPTACRCAVLGSPVGHSLSPVLHRAAHQALGLPGWAYEAIDCDEAGLAGFVSSRGPAWAGLSLTMPLKQAVLPLLTESEPLVRQVGAANTLIFANGARRGFNTDVAGLTAVLAGAAGAAGRPARGRTSDDEARDVVVLGGGATARAALAALRGIGVARVVVAVRDPARADGLLEAAARLGVDVILNPFLAVQLSGAQLVISTVPAAAADVVAEQILAATTPPGTVLDVVYHPWPTRVAMAAKQAGAVVVGGFELLLHQAARQVELMTGLTAPVDAMRAAGKAELASRGRDTS
jgi:shikimate dehydrogenase